LWNGAVRIGITLNAAATVNVTDRIARVGTLVVCCAEVHTELRERIAIRVNVVCVRRSVKVGTSSSAREGGAGHAATILVAIQNASSRIAVAVCGTVNAGTGGMIAHRLVRLETTIVQAVHICGASLAREISHTVVSFTRCLATIVVGRRG